MPDKVFVLHPLLERVDGRRLGRFTRPRRLRTLSWEDYARRKGVPMFGGNGGHPHVPGFLPGVFFDPYVRPPGEGAIEDAGTERALFDILVRHSPGGEDTTCTAVLGRYLGSGADPETAADAFPESIQRGPLRSARHELYEECDFVSPPQNLWPDDHAWILETDMDGYLTAISGPTALVADILASPVLEALRPPPT